MAASNFPVNNQQAEGCGIAIRMSWEAYLKKIGCRKGDLYFRLESTCWCTVLLIKY